MTQLGKPIPSDVNSVRRKLKTQCDFSG